MTPLSLLLLLVGVVAGIGSVSFVTRRRASAAVARVARDAGWRFGARDPFNLGARLSDSGARLEARDVCYRLAGNRLLCVVTLEGVHGHGSGGLLPRRVLRLEDRPTGLQVIDTHERVDRLNARLRAYVTACGHT